tara:strand:- start:333 stop:1103 length:771 start_codon:yes stop_codon:yes gene_type:complete
MFRRAEYDIQDFDKSFSCEVCGKQYTSEGACFNHELICKLTNNIEITEDKTINKALIYLLKENEKNKEKIKGLSKENNADYNVFKRHFVPEKWLTDNCNELDNINDWFDKFIITNEQLHYLKKNDKKSDYVKGISKIIPEIINKDCPIRCFDTRKNKIFIKNNDNWHLITKEELELLQNVISNRLWEEWQREKRKDDIEDIEYDIIVQGGHYSVEEIQDTIKKTINKCNVYKLDSLIIPIFKELEEHQGKEQCQLE